MSGYIGVQPVPQTTQTRESFTATAGQTSFGTSGYQVNHLDVYLNGVKLAAADYTATNGSDVVLASGAAVNDILEIVAFQSFTVLNQTLTGTTTIDTLTVTNAITANSTVDGRDVAADGTKLDTIETNATADQTAAEVRTLVESATDSNVFTDADHTKLNAIEASATADQTDAEIKTAVQNSSDIALAGNPTTTTQSANNNSTRIATTGYTDAAIAALADSAPATLNTLNELAAALGDDANFSTTVTNSIATKLPLAGGTMTGNIAHAGDLTLDVAGDIILDADGGDVSFRDDGVGFLNITNSSTDAVIQSLQNDKDLIFKGVDNGASITALTLDMSDAGTAIFNNKVGIGHASPTAPLDIRISGASGIIAEFHNTSGFGVDIGSDSDAVTYISGGYTQALAFKTNAGSGQVERMSISSAGNTQIKGGNELRVYRTDNNAYGSIKYLTGTGGLELKDVNGDGMSFKGASSTYMTIANSGNVGIGVTANSGALAVQAGTNAEAIHVIGRSSGDIGQINFFENDYSTVIGRLDGRADQFILNAVPAIPLKFNTNNTTRMTITSGGIVGIGTSSPATDAKLVVSNGGAQGVEFRADSSRIEYLHYNRSAGAYMPVRSNGLNFEWYLQNGAAMELDGSGNVAIKKDDTAIDTRLHIDQCPDNKVITFEQSGRKSAIGTSFSSGSTGSRLDFFVSDGNQNGGNNTRMSVLSNGGITFNGDTAAANVLDDFEEGTFQMTVSGVSSSAFGSGIYIKIGSLVHWQWYSGGMNVTGSGSATLSGLPFATTSSSAYYTAFTTAHNTYSGSAAVNGYLQLGGTNAYITTSGTTSSAPYVAGNPKYVMASGTYYTDA